MLDRGEWAEWVLQEAVSRRPQTPSPQIPLQAGTSELLARLDLCGHVLCRGAGAGLQPGLSAVSGGDTSSCSEPS